jgi:signal transduction histidine kinase
MRLNSLSFRLILSAALWTAVAIIAAGVILTSLYRRTVERTFDENLDNYLNAIVGEITQQWPDEVTQIDNLSEPLFGSVYSGWYWQISHDGQIVLKSQSLLFDALAVPDNAPARDDQGFVRFTATGPGGETIRAIESSTVINGEATYHIIVSGNATALRAEIASFRNSVILTLVVFGLALILSTFLLIRWGLRPLDRVRDGLASLRSGKEARLSGNYPAEILPLARELNALLESNQQVIERARTQVGNLAHALKTPLSVITNEARSNESPLADKVREQADLMRRQITHYLDRARIAARSEVIGAFTRVEPVMARMARAMNRIYGDKGVTVRVKIETDACFRGEQQDLEEIIGNLADNACKWAKSAVLITVTQEPSSGDSVGQLIVTIDDDGPGLNEEERRQATKRGQRLDESKPGSGLGLSIVTDLVGMYHGTFRLDAAPSGGLRAEIKLPAA